MDQFISPVILCISTQVHGKSTENWKTVTGRSNDWTPEGSLVDRVCNQE